MKVIKRNGNVEDFNKEKIENAIRKALVETKECGQENMEYLSKLVANDVCDELEDEYINIEDIQDIVEFKLMDRNLKNTAKAYILYRNKRKELRDSKAKMYIDMEKKIKNIINTSDVENSNANVNEYSMSGKNKRILDYVNKEYALNNLIPPHISKLHRDGILYQHDMDNYLVGLHNCLTIDFEDLFKNNKGFKTRNADVREPKSIMTFFQLVAVAFQLESQTQFGGVSSAKIDFEGAPYVKMSFKKNFKNALIDYNEYSQDEADRIIYSLENEYGDIIGLKNEKLMHIFPKEYIIAERHTIKETQQACESLYHNLGTLESRAGAQLPFTSINFGLDISPEGRLITKSLLQASINGIGRYHRTPIFPISIFQHKKGINANPGDPNYDLKKLAIKSLSKRIYPNFVNCDAPHLTNDFDNAVEIFGTMGCRTMLGYDINGLGNTQGGRGNIAPATLNLAYLGIKYGICLGEREVPDLKGFWDEFNELLKIQEESLLFRYEYIASQKAKSNPFLYENGVMKNTLGRKLEPDEEVRECVKHGTLAMGYIGLADCCIALFGKNQAEDEEVYNFAYSVVEHIHDYAVDSTNRNHLNFSCYGTPAEGTCSTLRDKLYNQYGEIKGITDKEYLTNSHHIPVDYDISIQRKIDLEAPFSKLATGGCIMYVELEGSITHNTDVVEDIINYAMESGLSYFALNFPISHCLDCHYDGDMNDSCPECKSSNIEILGRVTGYLSSDYRNFNKGKRQEFEKRVKHTLDK